VNNTTDEIEFVIRQDRPYGLYIRRTGLNVQSAAFGYTSLEGAERFNFALSAAEAIRARQAQFPDLGGHFVIVPVKVVTVPAVTETRVIEVKPATTKVELV